MQRDGAWADRLPTIQQVRPIHTSDLHRTEWARIRPEMVPIATVAFFGNLVPDALTRRGVANNREYTVRAIASIIAGHEAHHWRIFRERYLPGLGR